MDTILPLFLLILPLQSLAAFNLYIPPAFSTVSRRKKGPNSFPSHLNLVPISSLDDPSKKTFLESPQSFRACIEKNGNYIPTNLHENPYQLCIAEEDDLPFVSKLMIDAFGADAITLSKDLSPVEKALLNPGVEAFNSYSNLFAYTEVLSGLRQRLLHRLNKGNRKEGYNDYLLSPPPVLNYNDTEAQNVAARSSIILALGRQRQEDGADDRKSVKIIATVELRLQPTDAKIPFSEPWFDRLERVIARALRMDVKPKDLHLQPYLSNLCVDETARGRQIGKAMCRCVEKIAKDAWGYDKIYLHVDLENSAAINLYKKEGYRDVGSRWNPFWAGKASDIGYYFKRL